MVGISGKMLMGPDLRFVAMSLSSRYAIATFVQSLSLTYIFCFYYFQQNVLFFFGVRKTNKTKRFISKV